MPPTINIRLGGPGASPCNASLGTGGTCTISIHLGNLNLNESDSGGGLTEAQKDGEGAMRFIIAVLLVYSLMGTAGMLILRIRQTASRANNNKNEASKEANQYLKYRDKISADCRRARMVKETSRVLNHIQALERQRSCPESFSNTGNESQLSPLLSIHTGRSASLASTTSPTRQNSEPASASCMPSPLLDEALDLSQRQPTVTFPLSHTDLHPQSQWFLPPQPPFLQSPPSPASPLDMSPSHSTSSLVLLPPHLLTPPTSVMASLATPTPNVSRAPLATICEDTRL